MSYHPSTNDDTISYSLNKNNDACRNQRNSTKDIQPNFIKYNQNNNNTGITSPSLKTQDHKLRQKKKIIPKIHTYISIKLNLRRKIFNLQK